MLPWVEKYRPKRLSELVNQEKALPKVKAWVEEWLKGRPKKKAILLYGPPGVGKTATAYALANEYGFEVIELNASDERTYEKVSRYIQAAYTMDVFGRKRKLIFMDEADNMEPSGAYEIAKLIEKARNPIILSANKYWQVPQAIRSKAELIEYKKLTQRDIMAGLWRIVKAEHLEVPKEVIKLIAQRANGDLRAAINDLQTVAVSPEDAEQLLAYRDVEKSVFQALGGIFASDSTKKARMAMWNVDKTPDELLLWIDENIPYIYTKPEEIAQAYEAISRADIYFGRANRSGNYGLWKYAIDMMTAGVAVAGTKKKGFLRFYPPKTLKILRDSKEERGIRDSIIRKIMKGMHMSKLEAIETMAIFKGIFQYNPEKAAHIAVFLELGDKEIEFLTEDKEKAKSIKGKMMVIHKELKKTEPGEEVKVEKEEKEQEKVKEVEETQETVGKKEPKEPKKEIEEEKPKEEEKSEETAKEEKKPKQATLFDFIKKK
ncbi:hypothetical protein PAP_04165 [Palaeococcus pacificus DY20341]|uniref:Replication factor C large subunit n=1 Tax=Palaeococcus pacificus DY20341 TaxID=1343739 RepID=A0A075LXH1_9EURY|nr:replication factor C large subunit [Palaeococcus pacificus]AIF69248.1 hypothetical protein PAP_04165 [Palaeococcus pacificus DY20341]